MLGVVNYIKYHITGARGRGKYGVISVVSDCLV